MSAQTLFLPDDDATADLGRRLATVLRPGDLVVLEGDLGAGKTALARSVIRTLVGDGALDVPSPSFALVQPYEANGAPVLHADLYRISSPREVDELGLFDRADAIVLVEWPERSDEVMKGATVAIQLAVPPGGDGREATISFSDDRSIPSP
jgi:tRNA threonylcarbamoyl adenosine modification protein YjeE